MADSNKVIAAHQGRMDTNMIQIGIVKDNRDPKKMGRLKVWIQGSSALEDNKSGWIMCSYSSPFAGNTKGVSNAKSFKDYPKSYGFWAVPPDVGTRVFIFFVNGRQEHAYWFGCAYDYGMNGMVPAPSADIIAGSGHDGPIPVVEYDRNSPNGDVNAKYVNSTLLDGLMKQRLAYDDKVGSVNRSSRRQAPAQVYGMSTPRGNHIVLDDGYKDDELKTKNWDDDYSDQQFTEYGNPANDTTVGSRKSEGIVLRTRSGAQIVVSESDGFIFIINRDGTARITMTAEGDIEFLGRDIKFRANRNIEMRAEKDLKTEVFGNFNNLVTGTSSVEHKGNSEFTCHANHTTNIDGDKKVYAKGTLQLQGDSSVHVNSPAVINVSADGALSLAGSSGINMSGGGGNATLNSDLHVGNSLVAGSDVSSSSASLNGHTHKNVQNGEGVTPPPASGSGSSPSAAPAAPAEKASSTTTTRHEMKTVQDVVAVKAGGKVDKQVTADIGVTPTSSLSAMSAVMPASGVIDSHGYWGEKVEQADGKVANNPGWLIKGSGNVVAMYGGYVVNRTTNTVQIDHGNGFQSMYKGIKVSDNIQDGTDVTAGQVIGTYHDMFLFEIRGINAPLYGFTGTVDPGRFFIEETGVGTAAANKSLTINKKTNSTVEVVPTDDGQSTLVSKSTNSTICDSLVLSGSLNVPSARRVSEIQYQNAVEEQLEDELGAPTEIIDGWVVFEPDMVLRRNITVHEGSRESQAQKGTFKNNKFMPYEDLTSKAIGFGHNYGAGKYVEYGNGISEAKAMDLLRQDTEKAVSGAIDLANKYNLKIHRNAQRVLVEMVYQLGKGGVEKFVKFIAALQRNDYTTAGHELLNSKMYIDQKIRNRTHDYVALLHKN